MTATNHGLTGAVIGLSVNQPALALALALGSHFVLDSLPHFGNVSHTSRRFVLLLLADFIGIAFLLGGLVVLQPASWQLAVGCAVAAMSPDIMWLPNWLHEIKGGTKRQYKNFLIVFHKRIQQNERPDNWPIEVVWFTLAVAFVAKLTNF